MKREVGQAGAALALVALLGGGCSWVNPALSTAADAGLGGPYIAPRYSLQPEALADGYTIRRINGARGEPVEETLQVEAGNVWPTEEAPRVTLANPDAALRGVPPWRPSETRDGGDLPIDSRPGGPLVSPRADSSALDNEQRPQRLRRGSPRTPEPFEPPELQGRVQAPPRPPRFDTSPPPLSAGQPLVTPYGAVTTGGGTGQVQSFTTPGGGGGTIHRDGNTTIITPSGGPAQGFPTGR